MKPTFLLLLSLLVISLVQSQTPITYQEAIDNCRRITEEKSKANPDVLTYTGPDCMIGAMLPSFSYTTLEGKPFTTASLKGKITILNFWMISCPPCIAEIPGLNQVVQKYNRDDFNFIAIGMDDEKDITAFLKNHPWSFDQLPLGVTIILDDFNIRWGFPTTFVLDQDGVIIDAFSGGSTDEVLAVKEIDDRLSSIIENVRK